MGRTSWAPGLLGGSEESHMNWDALGAIAETLGAIAVVASLVYLGRQVRQGSREVHANTSNSVISAVQDGFFPLYIGDNAKVFSRGLVAPEELDDDERALFSFLMQRQVFNFQNVVFQYEHGSLAEPLFHSLLKGYEEYFFNSAGFRAWWKDNSHTLTPEMAKYVDRAAKGTPDAVT
jgi:hypothetical protein